MNTLTLNDELTAMNNELRRERLLTNIARRAANLFDDGYTATQTLAGQFVNAYTVRTPKGDRYTVKTSKTNAEPGTFFGSKCSCPCFKENLTCKHLLALELQEAQDASDAAQCAEWDALEASNDAYALRSDLNAYGY